MSLGKLVMNLIRSSAGDVVQPQEQVGKPERSRPSGSR